jgi:hypothetical protein
MEKKWRESDFGQEHRMESVSSAGVELKIAKRKPENRACGR